MSKPRSSFLKRGASWLWQRLPRPVQWRVRWVFSDRFLLGVTGIVLDDQGRVLLGQHVYRSGISWGLPGGGVQHGESLEKALCREVCEETGLSIQVRDLLLIKLDERRPLLDCFFWCEVHGSTEIVLSSELHQAGFYSLDALPGEVDPRQLELVRWAQKAQNTLV